MRIGLIADTHDRLSLIDRAVQRLNTEEVNLVLHAGDYIAPFVVSHFSPLKAKMIGVFGNNDAEQDLLRKKFEDIGIQVLGKFIEIDADNLRIALLHGHEFGFLKSLLEKSLYDIIVHGHTHQIKVKKNNNVLVINPGEVCGYLTGKSTIAILDTGTQKVEVIYLIKRKMLDGS